MPGARNRLRALPDRFRVSELGVPCPCRFRRFPVIFLVTAKIHSRQEPRSGSSRMLASRVRHVARGRSHTPMVLSRARFMLRSQSSVAFVRCHGCQKSLDAGVSPLLCGKCKGVAYCSAECQSRDWASNHGKECDNFARYMATEVNVSLATDGADEPSWLKAAMHHTCDQSYCSLLEQMGVHDNSAYRLLCGCQGAPSPYRALVEDIPGELVDSERTSSSTFSAAQRVHTWAEYYRARGVAHALSQRVF